VFPRSALGFLQGGRIFSLPPYSDGTVCAMSSYLSREGNATLSSEGSSHSATQRTQTNPSTSFIQRSPLTDWSLSYANKQWTK
jgi:hypothetical protein